jgi:hypothetical protein
MRKKRSTIGESPFDMLIPETIKENQAMVLEKQSQALHKSRLTTYITHTTLERVKNAVFWTPGLTVAEFTEQALIKAIYTIEGERGESFPPRSSDLKGGRPIKKPPCHLFPDR